MRMANIPPKYPGELYFGPRLCTRRLGPVCQDHGLVCARPMGEPVTPDSLSPYFSKLVRRVGLPPVRFHDLRHTHASALLEVGHQSEDRERAFGSQPDWIDARHVLAP